MAQYRIDTNQFLADGTTIYEVMMMADQDGNIINSFGAASNIIISSGDLAGYAGVVKFGSVYGTDSANMSTIWTAADTTATIEYDWTWSAGVLTVVSSSDSDTTTMVVEGLDDSYNEVSETFTLTGTSPTAAGSQTFARVHRAYMTGTATNVGKISIKQGTTIVGEIAADMGQSLTTNFTIPAGKTGYLLSMQAGASKNQVADIFFFQRPFGGAFRVAGTFSLNQTNQTADFAVPIKFTEKTDVEMKVRGSANATISADYTLVLVDNPS
jgi:hypothetical protein